MTTDIRFIVVERIQSNPWQTRLVDDEHIKALAEDIGANGLLQIPLGRVHPQDVEAVQLAFGHNRFEAWKIAKPNEPFPVAVRELSDLQMSDMAASENAARKNLTAVETALMIQKRMQYFQLSQLEAGRPFGYKTQGAVANLLRLLKLPEAIQPYVGDGGLPERHARMLVNVAKVFPKQVEQVAKLVIAAEEKDQVFDRSFEKMLQEKGRYMLGAPFDKVVGLSSRHVLLEAKKFLGDSAFLPVCKGCEFFVSFEDSEYCMRPACYDLKVKAFAYHEVERLGKKLGIVGVLSSSLIEKMVVVYDGHTQQQEQQKVALLALKTKHESLRLRPLWATNDHNDLDREWVLGSKFVALYTTDMLALKKAIAQLPKEKKEHALSRSMDAGKRDEKRMRERRDECRRLILAAAPHFAKAFADCSEALLDVMIPAMANHHYMLTSRQVEARAKKADEEEKVQIVAEIVLANGTGGAVSLYSGVTLEAVVKKIQELAARLRVKLPSGWHVVQQMKK